MTHHLPHSHHDQLEDAAHVGSDVTLAVILLSLATWFVVLAYISY